MLSHSCIENGTVSNAAINEKKEKKREMIDGGTVLDYFWLLFEDSPFEFFK